MLGDVCDHMHGHICDFIMYCKLEQRANIKFCVKLGKSATKSFGIMHHAYGNEAMSHVRCFEWHTPFMSGRTSVNDDKRSGRPSMS